MATATEQSATKASPPWERPLVYVGDIVMWHPGAEKAHALPAVVTDVSPRNINLRVLQTQAPKPSVQHVDDPELVRRPQLKSAGGWSHTGGTLARMAALGRLERRVSQLESARVK